MSRGDRPILSILAVTGALALPAQQTVRPADTDRNAPEAALFDSLPTVEAASLHAQDLKDAPASVTVLTAREIRRYGYRTLAEVLASTRGFSMSHDSFAWYAGVRGFSLPGDYNSRILVMINGHVLTDNVYNAMYVFGQDFGLDLDLVERIEIIRGPSSALYGSNGVFATVNIVTRSPVEEPAFRLSTEIGSFGEKKLILSASTYLGRGANLLLALSGFHSAGRPADIPDSSGLENSLRRVEGVGADQGYHGFANLIWQDWSFTAYWNDRKGLRPAGLYFAIPGDPGNWESHARNFLEAVWNRPVGASAALRWRLSYDQYRYRGRYDYQQDDGGVLDQRDEAFGDWLGTQLYYQRTLASIGEFTAGGEASADLRNLQQTYLLAPVREQQLRVEARDVCGGVFLQQQWILSRAWTLYGGLRLDESRLRRRYLSPRAALIWRPSPQTSWKFLYGRAFRNPSAYEMFYASTDGLYLENPGLGPERIQTLEVSWERKFRRWELLAGAHRYRLADLIQQVELPSGGLQFHNRSYARGLGAEFEARTQLARGLEAAAAAAIQQASATGRRLENSPRVLAQGRVAMPLRRNRLGVASTWRYWSSRLDRQREAMPGVVIWDVTLAGRRVRAGLEIEGGLSNLLNRRYEDPLSPEHPAVRMPRAGRSVYLKLTWRQGG